MSCELCGHVERRSFRVTRGHFAFDGIPLVTYRRECIECGWWQAAVQEWPIIDKAPHSEE